MQNAHYRGRVFHIVGFESALNGLRRLAFTCRENGRGKCDLQIIYEQLVWHYYTDLPWACG